MTEHLQISADITATDTSDTVASGGVAATPATGTELYYSAQLIANDMFNDGDMYLSLIHISEPTRH